MEKATVIFGKYLLSVGLLLVSSSLLAQPLPRQSATNQEAACCTKIKEDQWYLPIPAKDGSGTLSRSLFIHEFGSGDPVVVVHGGWGAEHSYMKNLMLSFADVRRIIFYDQRGSLRSRCGESCPGALPDHIQDLENIRIAVGVDKLTIVAHSMGTFLAQSYAERYPLNVKKLVLLGAIPAKVNDTSLYFESIQKVGSALTRRDRVKALEASLGLDRDDLTGRQISDSWKIKFSSVNLYDPSHWRAFMGGQALYNQGAANKVKPSLPDAWDFEPVVAALPQPVDVIIGTHDYVDWRSEYWTALSKNNESNVRLHLIDKAEHTGWYEKPAAFHDALQEALSPIGQSD